MGYRLRRHPFDVSAHFRHSLVLAYALPAGALEPLLPETLEPDRHGDLGFAAAALVQTKDMRPSFFPGRVGLDFFLAGYRIFVRVAGRPSLRGLYEAETGRLLSVRGVRSAWDSQPVAVDVRELSFFSLERFGAEPVLANAFYVADVDYRWQRGQFVV